MEVRAPGKVVLLGEYAVLDGAPAVVTAVDRGVRCVVGPSETLRITVPGGDDRFARAALLAAGAPPATYAFSDWNPVASATKVGLGGSAAAVVAAVVAARALRGEPPDPAAVFGLALRVHREVQGSGSGIDVAASAYGGTSRFESGAVTPVPAVAPVVVFSGTSADTGPRVEAYRAWAGRSAFVAESRRLVDAFPTAPVAALDAAGRLLRDMADRAGLAYWTAPIDRLVTLARTHGGAAKPSGAGGGDIVVALFPDAEAGAAYARAADREGFLVIPVGPAPAARALRGDRPRA